jgi:selenocysteine-specific elongation factor
MKHLIIGTAGHIDHGKTSLIKMLTGVDCDTHKQEKERGITINLGFSHINLPSGESAGIIDVPGHKDFINTMAGGACGIDLVLLVIAADSGMMPQTIEHINIITSLGIKNGVVALTKTDLVDDELIEMASAEISEYLDNTCLKGIPVIGVSSHTGKGKDELIKAIDETVNRQVEPDKGNLFRMYIDRVFTVKGLGSVVTGSVMGGSISSENEVLLLPGDKRKLRIRSIERHGKTTDSVVRGDRAAINLTGMKLEDYKRGMLISNKQLDSSLMIDAYISTFNTAAELKIWSNISLVSGTYISQARMHLLDKDIIYPGEDALVQIHLKDPTVLLSGDRFIFRNSSDDLSLGGGFVIDPFPLHHRKRTPKLINSLKKLSDSVLNQNSLIDLINQVLVKEFRPFYLAEVAEKINIDKNELISETEKDNIPFCVYSDDTDKILVAESFDFAYQEKIIKILSNYHSDNPLFAKGLEVSEIAGKLTFSKIRSGKSYLERLLNKMFASATLEKHEKTWIIKGHQPQIDEKTKSGIQWLENEILSFKDGRPIIAEIEERALNRGIQSKTLKSYMSLLANQGIIRYINNDFVHMDVLNQHRVKLLNELSKTKEGIDYQQFKEFSNATKAFRAILLEAFEKEKIIKLIHGKDIETRIAITETGKRLIK